MDVKEPSVLLWGEDFLGAGLLGCVQISRFLLLSTWSGVLNLSQFARCGCRLNNVQPIAGI